MAIESDPSAKRARALQQLLEAGRERILSLRNLKDRSGSIDEPTRNEIERLLDCVVGGCEFSEPTGTTARIRDPDRLASEIIRAGLTEPGGSLRFPIKAGTRQVGFAELNGRQLLAELLSRDEWLEFCDLWEHVLWARQEFYFLIRLARSDVRGGVARWKAELRSAWWTIEDLETALRAGAVECLQYRPVIELLRDQLVGTRPAAMVQRIAEALKYASERSPEPTSEQVDLIRPRVADLETAIDHLGVDDWSDRGLRDALEGIASPEAITRAVETAIHLKRNRQRRSRVLAHIVGHVFGLRRDFGYRLLSMARNQSRS